MPTITAFTDIIATPLRLENVEAICAVTGLHAVYFRPSALRLAVGGASPSDVSVDDQFEAALTRIHEAAAAAGIAAGIHTPSGDVAAQRLSQGYTFASVASDLTHLKAVSSAHLKAALGK
jgi:4-hydroxy-2-oxoheptanedioate aldolase